MNRWDIWSTVVAQVHRAGLGAGTVGVSGVGGACAVAEVLGWLKVASKGRIGGQTR
jgi:hypothetical protein